MVRELCRDNDTIAGRNSQLMNERRDVTLKLKLVACQAEQVVHECVRLQNLILNTICYSALDKFESEVKAAQEEVLADSQEMNRQVAS